MKSTQHLIMGVLLSVVLFPWTAVADDNITPAAADFYREKVAPILAENCMTCHGPKSKLKADLFLGSREGLLKGGESGPAVDLEKPAESLLIGAISYGDYKMPPKAKMSDEKIGVLTKWVEMGIPIPRDAETARPELKKPEPEVNEVTKKFWSFQPIANPTVPDVKHSAWPTNSIDNFILARLEEAGLTPVAPATRWELIRRAYYDLTGLPPSIEQVEAFVNDKSPKAFEKVVDRLLDSPQYGERWGRHWLDVVRFAETNSYERDGTKPFAWRYHSHDVAGISRIDHELCSLPQP